MAKYGECGDSEYTMVAFADLFDLRYARIYKAIIGTVDRANNTASITIPEECPDLEGVDLSSVPFFYHCEDSTGTVEDLERGHLAFNDGDEVFAILVPQNGDIEERFFVIGHVDIRTNRFCARQEYLLVYMGDVSNPPLRVTIFDVSAGGKLDIASFQNLDESSPEKPSTLPCLNTTAFWDWFSYNFKPAVAACDVWGSGSQWVATPTGNYSPASSVVSDTDSCSIVSQTIYYDHDTKRETRTEQYEGSNLQSGWFCNHTGSYVREYSTGDDTEGWLFENDLGADFYYYIRTSGVVDTYYEYSTTFPGAPWTATFSRSFAETISVLDPEFSARGVLVKESETIGTRTNSDDGLLSGTYYTGLSFRKWNVIKVVGELGIYTIFGAALNHGEYATEIGPLTFGALGAKHNTDICVPGYVSVEPQNSYEIQRYDFAPVATVSMISQIPGIDIENPVSLRLCMGSSDASKSVGLEVVVRELALMVMDADGWTVASQGVYLAAAYTKKKIEV